MANYQLLKADIDAKVYENAYREITGENLNSVLNAMVTTLGAEYQFAGAATIDTNPGTPDAKVFYIANGKGTYTNFGGIEVTEDDIVVLYWDSAWHKVSTGIASQEKLSELYMGDNLLNIHGYIALTGDLSLSEAYRCSDFILYDGHSNITILDGFSGFSSNLISFYDQTEKFISGINNANNLSLSKDDIPDGTRYFRISSRLEESETLKLYYSSIIDTLQIIKKEVGGFDNRITKNEVKNEVNQNAFDSIAENQSYPLTTNGFYDDAGNFAPTENAKNTGLIPITARGIIKYYVNLSSSGLAVAFFDYNKKIILSISVKGIDVGYASGEIDISGQDYDNAVYFAISNYGTDTSFYRGEMNFSPKTIGNRVADLEQEHSFLKKDLKILIFGDSITDCAHLTITDNKTSSYSVNPNYQNSYVNKQGETIHFCMWPYLITRYFLTFDVRNYAQFGASYKDQSNESYPRMSLSYQIEVAFNDITNPNNVFPTQGIFIPDIIIFALGTNDGAPNDTFQSAMDKTIMDGNNFDVDATLNNLDRSKFCESVRYAFLKVKQKFPQSLCLCVLPIQRTGFDIQSSGVNNELRKMAERYSIIVVDGASQSGIIRDLEKDDAVGANLKDGLHPNDKGQNLYTRMIVSAIKNNFIDSSLMNQ